MDRAPRDWFPLVVLVAGTILTLALLGWMFTR